jgi:cytidine deaminase
MQPMNQLSPALHELYERAEAAAANAYVPYSRFRVGAALAASDGRVIEGANVENASYGLTICAERVACTAAVAAGVRSFAAIAIHVDGADGQPCGACRQVLAEFAPDLTVVYRRAGELVARPLAELLPDAFVPAALTDTGRTA